MPRAVRPVLLVLFLLTALGRLPAQAPPELTIPAIFAEGGVTGRAPETVRFSPDGSKVSFAQRDDAGARGQLWYVDVATGEPAVLVSEQKLAGMAPPAKQVDEREKERLTRYAVAGYHWSPDSQHILFDSRGLLWLYSLEAGVAIQMGAGTGVRDPKFSPDGDRISYVREGDLYVVGRRDRRPRRLTRSVTPDILNGDVDWVYAEELDVRSNYFWSPDGRHIAYLQMDQSNVPTHPIADLVPVRASLDLQKYPKAGDPNPVVRLGVVGARGGRTRWIDLQRADANDLYIPRFGWIRPGLLYVQVLNRAQDRLDLYFVDANSGRSRRVLRERSDDAWVEVNDDFRVLKSGDRFLWTSWRDGYTHIYLYRFDAGNPLGREAVLERQLTRGAFETFGVKAVDEDAGTAYFVANEGDPRQRHLYAVKLDGSGLRRISQEAGTHSPTFAPGARHYVDNHAALKVAPRLRLCAVEGACTTLWQSRDVAGLRLQEPQLVSFEAADGTELLGTLFAPPEFESAAPGSVPVILAPYGGPIGQRSRDDWGGTTRLFHEILARRGFAILQVDNRGTGGRGRQFAAALRHNMGSVEVEDQLAALDQALQRWPQLDGARAAMWGWSYGGYMTLRAMTLSDRFRAGVAVAPVTDWRFYDTIYTERYMGLPRQNREGYERSAPLRDAGRLSGSLLLVHGTSDDNVHLQNTTAMANALIEAGKQFDLQLYPRKTHGIAGAAARTHLFTRILQHLEGALLAAQPATQVAEAGE